MSSDVRDALVQQVAQRFEETGFRPDFGPAGAKLLVPLYDR
ncbi:MAG TPA: hypothetical protein QGI71_01910 [Dehalococcoidia bacterium]|nr:hypothetical protein [Dehalococcoidia bacterium]